VHEVDMQDVRLSGPAEHKQQGSEPAHDAIRAAFTQAMTSTDAVIAMAAVQDGDPLVPVLARFVDAFPEVVGILTVDVGAITQESGRTLVSFNLAAPGYGELSLQGEAVRVDGTWKVARSTIAGMLGAAGFAPDA